jgi:glycosyltransferase involved in cell wall biosynthesis
VKQRTAKVAQFARRGYKPPKAAPAPSAPSGKSQDFRVLYLLPKLDLYGGVVSVVQIVNHLIQLGAKANIATYSEPNENFLRGMPLYFTPYFQPFRRAALEDLPECDLLVATWWETVYDALEIQQRRPHIKLAYFVQDYEPAFYPPGSSEAQQAELTYSLIGPKIAKTDWLIRRLQSFPGVTEKIPLGLDLDVFYDRKNPARQKAIRIAAMARPSSRYRNYSGTIEILKEVKQRRPEAVISLYGAELKPETLPFECEISGPLNQREGVAELLNRSTVLLDCSIFQGFGRPGLEAMACGTATVLTREGGITEYAKHQHNCLLADPRDVEDNVNKILQLIDDEKLRARLVAEGLNTARKFDSRLEGERTLACFRRLMSD